MIIYKSGDIFAAEVDAVVNTVNTVGVMGKGLALQFKRRYPANYDAYRNACKLGEVNLGHMFVTETHELRGPRLIVNFPTKGHWKANSRLNDIRTGLDDLVRVIQEYGVTSIAVPPLGAGNGGLNWNDVRPIIHEALSGLDEVRVEVFEPVKAHFSVQGEPTKLTRTPALMLELMLAYARQRRMVEPWEDARGASHLEVQKLMYFASCTLPSLNLGFKAAKYGPYSDIVRIMLQKLEGSLLSGLGDGNDRVLELHPIEVTERGIAELSGFRDPEVDRSTFEFVVEHVMNVIHGFEGAYPLELLSSVKWATDSLSSMDAARVTSYIHDWNPRKGELFKEHDVRVALAHLAE